MDSNSLKELAIKSPKRYKIALAIARGLNEGKQLKEVFVGLGINQNTGYSVANQLKKEIAEMRYIQTEASQNPSNLLEAKKILEEAGPELAQVIVDLALNEKTPDRERRQAAKDGLQLAGMEDATQPAPDVDKTMKKLVMNTFNIHLEREEKDVIDLNHTLQTDKDDSK